jgi:hypothetical protein
MDTLYEDCDIGKLVKKDEVNYRSRTQIVNCVADVHK